MEIQAWGTFEAPLHAKLVSLRIALGPGSTDRGSVGRIQQTPLNCGRIGVFRHDSTERIDFADHVSLGQATNGRVAAHLPDGIEILGQHSDLGTETSSSESRLNTSALLYPSDAADE